MKSINSEHPLVSVIMPTYNHGKFIGKAIESALNQTYPNFELIIIDNFSEDNTSERIASYSDDRIKCIKFRNHGIIAASRNHGMKHAKGKYIAFLDSDDIWLPEKLQKQVNFLENNRDIFLLYAKCIVEKDGRQLKIVPKKPKSGYMFKDLLMHFNSIPILTVMIRNRKKESPYFFDEDERLVAVEDYAMWLLIAYKEKISYINEPLAIYRVHSKSISSGAFFNFRKCGLVLKKFSPFVSKATLFKSYCSYYRTLIYYGMMDSFIAIRKNLRKDL